MASIATIKTLLPIDKFVINGAVTALNAPDSVRTAKDKMVRLHWLGDLIEQGNISVDSIKTCPPMADSVGVDNAALEATANAASASDALNKWASLYVTDNRAELKNHVNSDSGRPDRTYQGLPGNFTLLGNPTVLYVFETTPPSSTKPHYMVRIQLPLSKDGFKVLSEMDVLVLK